MIRPGTATKPITLKRLSNLNLSWALFFFIQACQTALESSALLPVSTINPPLIVRLLPTIVSKLRDNGCAIVHSFLPRPSSHFPAGLQDPKCTEEPARANDYEN